MGKLRGRTFALININTESVTVWWDNWTWSYETGALCLTPFLPDLINRGKTDKDTSLPHLPSNALQNNDFGVCQDDGNEGCNHQLSCITLATCVLLTPVTFSEYQIYVSISISTHTSKYDKSMEAILGIRRQDSSESWLLRECQSDIKGRAEEGLIAHFPKGFLLLKPDWQAYRRKQLIAGLYSNGLSGTWSISTWKLAHRSIMRQQIKSL